MVIGRFGVGAKQLLQERRVRILTKTQGQDYVRLVEFRRERGEVRIGDKKISDFRGFEHGTIIDIEKEGGWKDGEELRFREE
jgi:hypothetical protein